MATALSQLLSTLPRYDMMHLNRSVIHPEVHLARQSPEKDEASQFWELSPNLNKSKLNSLTSYNIEKMENFAYKRNVVC